MARCVQCVKPMRCPACGSLLTLVDRQGVFECESQGCGWRREHPIEAPPITVDFLVDGRWVRLTPAEYRALLERMRESLTTPDGA